MKPSIIPILILTILILAACEKEVPQEEPKLPIEYHFQLKSGEIAYSDDDGNYYYTGVFDMDTLQKNYSISIEKDIEYRISLSNIDCENVDFYFLEPDLDTLYHGEQANQGNTLQYIHVKSAVTDTFYITLRYTGDINFHKKEFHLAFEDVTIADLEWKGHIWQGTRDWIVNNDGNLQIAMHNTGSYRWLRLSNPDLLDYELEVSMAFKSGLPESLAGIATNASEEIRQNVNVPMQGYSFLIKGPYSFQVWYAHGTGGTGFEYGYTSARLNTGMTPNKISLSSIKDSLLYSINDEQVYEFKNLSFMTSYVYLIVEDIRLDTVVFDDFKLNVPTKVGSTEKTGLTILLFVTFYSFNSPITMSLNDLIIFQAEYDPSNYIYDTSITLNLGRITLIGIAT